MLVSFSVSNYRSFREEQTFSLVASKRFSEDHPEHTVAIPGTDERVLRFGVLYGANGAGKSNLLKALQFVRGVAYGQPSAIYEPFRFGAAAAAPTVFDLQFIAGGKLYRFGLTFDESRIIDEFLMEGTGEAEIVLFERSVDQLGVVSVRVPDISGANEKLGLLAQIGVHPQRTFLGSVQQNIGPFEVNPNSHRLAPALAWLARFVLFAPDYGFFEMPAALSGDEDLRAFVGQVLASSDTGVDGIRVIENPKLLGSGGLASLSMEKLALQTDHGARSLPIEEESDGTQRLVHLARILHMLANTACVVFVDEIERSLHQLLVHKILNDFLAAEGPGQLIVTTHDASLLELDLLRRDEIWFAEKDREGATHLYSLSDYEIRNDEIKKHYLQGRFGAVPFLAGANLVALKESEVK